MHSEPSLTFSGALEVLGHHERPVLERLDKILGGLILASGAAAAIAAVAGHSLEPAGLWAAVWGWTEQKDAAVDLVNRALDSMSGKLVGASGNERRQLVAVAHTTIVVSAFWEVFPENINKEICRQLKVKEWDDLKIKESERFRLRDSDQFKIKDSEKEALLAGRKRENGETLFDFLYAAEVPIPSASRGFEETVPLVRSWITDLVRRVNKFINGLSAYVELHPDWQKIIEESVERYQSHYIELAAKVTEFAIWVMLSENAATRSLIRAQNSDLARVLAQRDSDAMARMETLLALMAGSVGVMTGLRDVVANANRMILDEQIFPAEDKRHGPDVTFSSVRHMYIDPRFRVIKYDEDARPADERWWTAHRSRAEFDIMFAAYVTDPDATRLPVLLLGDPGAGKSLLTKVLAARLPSSVYTVVWVPLRRVSANGSIVSQVQQALNLATNERVNWGQLSDQSDGTTRVIVLDGLDELLQASSSDRSGYLQDVVEFQRVEAAQDRSVIVIVTSRIVVADRVEIPRGSTVVKLDTFTDDDISDWLSRWVDANSAAIAAGKVHALTLEVALCQPELARQPLLLLMLALYTADPASPALTSGISTADLYQNLLEEFARREARKAIGPHAREREVEERAQKHLGRLAVAAFGMFNRGRQDITEADLGADLFGLKRLPKDVYRLGPEEEGQRVIGEFFFVHSPQAYLAARGGQTQQSYEFLHATFGEYLVTSLAMSELIEVADKTFAGKRSEPDDNALFALLSHQPLAVRRSTFKFAEEIGAELPADKRSQILDVLEMLLESYRDRHGSDLYENYRPKPRDTVRQLACYSANLVSLRAALEPGDAGVPLTTLLRAPGDEEALGEWRSMVTLWRAALDADGMQSVLTSLTFLDGPPRIRAGGKNMGVAKSKDGADAGEIWYARLLGDWDMEQRTRYGAALWDRFTYEIEEEPEAWVRQISSALISLTAGVDTSYTLSAPSKEVSDSDVAKVAKLIFNYLKVAPNDNTRNDALIRYLFDLPQVFKLDQYALARSVLINPGLLDQVPELADSRTYGSMIDIIVTLGKFDLFRKMKNRDPSYSRPNDENLDRLLSEIVRYQSMIEHWEL